MTLPDFLVIGAQRAGTSLLYRILRSHPEVYVPAVRKEVHFFDWYYDRGIDWYRGFFPSDDDASHFRAVGEVTPDYLGVPDAAERIHKLLPDCRLVVILRNPVERAWSWYQYARRSYNEQRDFDTFIESDQTVLEWGLYYKHLERYRRFFREQQLLVLIYEELVEGPARELARLAQFLELSQGWPEPAALLSERVNPGVSPRFRESFAVARRIAGVLMRNDVNWPVRLAKQLGVRSLFGKDRSPVSMSLATRAQLVAYFQSDVNQLKKLLRKDLHAWGLWSILGDEVRQRPDPRRP